MNIAVIGAGQVGGSLAQRLAEAGHEVVLAEREPGSADAACARSSRLTAAPTEDAVRGAEAVILATPYGANASVIGPLADALVGKILVDCTNPVGPGLTHGLKSERSGSEVLQALAPRAKVVKAFTIYGFENLERFEFSAANVKPAMFFCGDDAAAKARVAQLITDCGFEPLDVGGLGQALHLEHMTLLWVRMVRVNGHSPRLTWAALTG